MDFAVRANHNRKRKDIQMLGFGRRTLKAAEVDSSTCWSWNPWNCPQRLGGETGETGDQRRNRDNSDYSTDEIK